MTAETVAQAFLSGWIARFGVPSTVTTDRGRQFESLLWSQFMQLLGCKCIHTTSYHPIANGMIERFHRQLKASLKAQLSSVHWTDSLPLVLLGIRTTLKEDCSVLLQKWCMELAYDYQEIFLMLTPQTLWIIQQHMLLDLSQLCNNLSHLQFASHSTMTHM